MRLEFLLTRKLGDGVGPTMVDVDGNEDDVENLYCFLLFVFV
jgi:hypothetical protein